MFGTSIGSHQSSGTGELIELSSCFYHLAFGSVIDFLEMRKALGCWAILE